MIFEEPTFLNLKHLLTYNYNIILIKDGNFHLAKIRDITLDHILDQKPINFTTISEYKSTANTEMLSEDDKNVSNLKCSNTSRKKHYCLKENQKIKKKLSKQISDKNKDKMGNKKNKKISIIRRLNFSNLTQENSDNVQFFSLERLDEDIEYLDQHKFNEMDQNKRVSQEEIVLLKSKFEEICTNVITNKFKKSLFKNDWSYEKCKCFEMYMMENMICLVK